MDALRRRQYNNAYHRQTRVSDSANPLTRLARRYWHIVPLLAYAIVYLAWFGYLEKNVVSRYRVIHVALDDYIPFCEVFVVPYLLWFGYVAVTVLYFFLHDRDEYFKVFIFLCTGMTIFLLVSTLWPNGHHLRPYVMPRDNIFTQMVAALYRTDTPTNLWPSIHVYNSLGCHIAVAKSRRLQKHRAVQICSFVLCVSIILSTMFIKQHSVYDVLTAFIMAGIMYGVVYHFDALAGFWHNLMNRRKQKPEVSQRA